MLAHYFLGFNAMAFLGYGIACLFWPSIVGDAAQLGLQSGTAVVEVRAMYGGLQTAIGALALLGFRRPDLRVHALLPLLFIFVGLVTGRGYGIAVDADPGAYNYGAVVFEGISAAITLALLLRRDP